MENRLEAGLLLHDQGSGERAHAGAGPRPIGDVHEIHAVDAELPRLLNEALGVVAARRHQLDADREQSAGERVREPRLLRPRDGLRFCDRVHARAVLRTADRRMRRWRQRAYRRLDVADVIGRRPAAAADEADAVVEEAPARTTPCTPATTGRCCVPRSLAAGRRSAAPTAARAATRAMRSTVSSMPAGPTLQLTPITATPSSSSCGTNASGATPSSVLPSSSVVTWATIGRSESPCTARIAAAISFMSWNVSSTNRSTPPSIRSADLFAEVGLRFVDAGLAPGLDADPQRTDRARDVRLLPRGVPGDACALRR